MFLDENGEILAQQNERSVEAFQRSAAGLKTLAALEGKDQRTAEEEARYFLALVDLGKIGFEEAQEMRKKLPSAPAELGKQVDQRMTALEVEHLLSTVRSAEQAAEVGARFAEMAKAGRIPAGKGFTPARFWMAISEHAKAEKNAALFEKALHGLKEALDHDARYQRMFDEMEKALAELKDK